MRHRRRPDNLNRLRRSPDPARSVGRRTGRRYRLRLVACPPSDGALGAVAAADRTARSAAAVGSGTRSKALPDATGPEPVRILAERNDQRRARSPRVAEIARHPSENGWIYDRAA